MTEHDFGGLFDQYQNIIEQMQETFTSHKFILELARQNQTLYIEALYSYRHHLHRESPAPFLIVHGILAQHLLNYPHLIRQLRKDTPSINIFGEDDSCSEWAKI